MADLNNSINLSRESLLIISQKKATNKINYKSWSDKDLMPVRKEIRDFYRIEQKGICCFCKQTVSLTSALNCQIEHIVPKKLHEDHMFNPKNLCVICADCNEIKRDQETLGIIPETMKNAEKRKFYPRSSSAFLIVHPHFDNWEDHILIFNGLYADKTPKGHFTIGTCKLNRKLHRFGWDETLIDDEEINTLMNNFLKEKDSIKRMKILNVIRKIR